MRKMKVALGIFLELMTTFMAVGFAGLFSYVMEEMVHFRSEAVTAAIIGTTVSVTYLIWYLIKEHQTRDMKLSHYHDWPIYFSLSLIGGIVLGLLAGVKIFEIMDYEAWIYFVVAIVGIILQGAGILAAYITVRPR